MGVYLLLIGTSDVIYRDQYNRYAMSWMESWCCQTAGFLAVLSCEVRVVHRHLVEGYILARYRQRADRAIHK